jgi:hypothetical protein
MGKTIIAVVLLVIAVFAVYMGFSSYEQQRELLPTGISKEDAQYLREENQLQTHLAVAAPAGWQSLGSSINPIDGVKTQQLFHTQEDGIPGKELSLVLSFDNGRLSSKNVGIYLEAGGMVAPASLDDEYHTPVRMRFDDGKPISQKWTITDDHKALTPCTDWWSINDYAVSPATPPTPYSNGVRFLGQLLHHKKLIVEFSLYEEAPRTVTFNIDGLADEMKKAGLR